jgi:hypothetical protein
MSYLQIVMYLADSELTIKSWKKKIGQIGQLPSLYGLCDGNHKRNVCTVLVITDLLF